MSLNATTSTLFLNEMGPIQQILKNDSSQTDVCFQQLDQQQQKELFKGLVTNTFLKILTIRNSQLNVVQFSTVLTENHSLTKLNLDGCKLSNHEVKVIVTALKVNYSITDFGLRFCELTDIADLMDFLSLNNSLLNLNLNGNKFGDKGGKALASALKYNNSLKELDIASCGLTDINGLADMLKVNRSLSKLNLANNMIIAGLRALISALRNNDALTDLNMHSCTDGGIVIDGFTDMLKINCSLMKLDISSNEFVDASGVVDASGSQAVAGMLEVNRSLLTLNLNNTTLGNDGLHDLAYSLQNNCTLTELSLASIEVTEIFHFAILLKSYHYLQILDLSYNKIGIQGGNLLAEALRSNTSLKKLDLSSCELMDIAQLANMLHTNRSLSALRLGFNNFGNSGGKLLIAALKVNSTLDEISMFECGVEDTIEQQIREQLCSNRCSKILKQESVDKEKDTKAAHAATGITENASAWSPATMPAKTIAQSDNNSSVLAVGNFYHPQMFQPQSQQSSKLETDAITSTTKLANSSLHFTRTVVNPKLEVHPLMSSTSAASSRSISSGQTGNSIQRATRTSSANATNFDVQRSTHQRRHLGPSSKAIFLKPSTTIATDDKINAATLARFDALEKRIDRVEISPPIDAATAAVLKGQAAPLRRIFAADASLDHIKREEECINANPSLTTYYHFFERRLHGTWIACRAIVSDMVANGEKYKSDYFAQGVDKIGSQIPGVSLITGLFAGGVEVWNATDKRQAVQRIASLFLDNKTAERDINALARQATLAQEKAICYMPTSQTLANKFKEQMKDIAAFIVASDANTPLIRKAEEDCKKLLAAVRKGQLPSNHTLDDLLGTIMGPSFKYKSPVIVTKHF